MDTSSSPRKLSFFKSTSTNELESNEDVNELLHIVNEDEDMVHSDF